MTDLEFDVLGELYFIIDFQQIVDNLSEDEGNVKECLFHLFEKSWIRCYENVEDELPDDQVDFENNYKNYYYLATKKGLMAHNMSEDIS